jgi:hypothetical protein
MVLSFVLRPDFFGSTGIHYADAPCSGGGLDESSAPCLTIWSILTTLETSGKCLPLPTIRALNSKNIPSIVIIAILLTIAGGFATTCASHHARFYFSDSRKIGFFGLAAFNESCGNVVGYLAVAERMTTIQTIPMSLQRASQQFLHRDR